MPGCLFVLKTNDSSAGVVQGKSGGNGEQTVEGVDHGLRLLTSQPQGQVGSLVSSLVLDDSLRVHYGMYAMRHY